MSNPIIKRGQAVTSGKTISVSEGDIKTAAEVLDQVDVAGREALEQFCKTAADLKSIAPKAKDFLYFTAIMMHAAEAALVDDSGNIKTASDGSPLTSEWLKNDEAWKWSCSDPNLLPYKNSNNDIFPEVELKKAYRDWIGKPLCLDHKSSSVDSVRGVVVDTYYDNKYKRIVALCALDKKNYPDLARKVSTGYATSVSMGTAVGKAICSDCGNVAKIESDFCDHMRNKSCYGEINVELKPIELSIVVNGADQKAKIRHIVASADSIANYVEMKEKDLADKKALSADEIQSLKADVGKLQNELEKLDTAVKDADSNESADPAYGQPGRGSLSMESPEGTYPESKKDLSTPPLRYASENEEMHGRVANLHEKLDNFINKLAFKLTDEDLQMANKKAYFQGGGGVNEPTPKQTKYDKEDYQSIRDNIDKQMNGQSPFPDTGPVDGMHPGYDSFGESEEARKKRLQRLAAEQERRQIRRQAALDRAKEALSTRKRAYHQGGGEANDPAKLPYEKEDYKATRDKEDKQMTGQAPFPGVGAVDGLHPSPVSADEKDELKRKQLLQRAGLSARFVKAANADGSENKAKSYWQVLANKKEIMRLSVEELTGGKVEALYDAIYNKPFGKKILATIKSEGFERATQIFKSAQPVPAVAGPGGAPGGAPDAAGMPGEMPGDMPEGVGEDIGADGDSTEQVGEKIRELDNLVQELSEAFEALKDQDLPEEMPAEMGVAASAVSPQAMCKTLNGALRKGIKQAVAEIKDHVEELKLVSYVYDTNGAVTSQNSNLVRGVTKDAIEDANKTIANTYKLMNAFVKYARGAEALVKKADEDTAFDADALAADDIDKSVDDVDDAQDIDINSVQELDALLSDDDNDAPPPGAGAVVPMGELDLGGAARSDAVYNSPGVGGEVGGEHKVRPPMTGKKPAAMPVGGPRDPGDAMKPGRGAGDTHADPKRVTEFGSYQMADDGDENAAMLDLESKELKLESPDELKELVASDLTTKEGRAQMRTKIAQKGLQFSEMLQKAHPSGGATTDLDNNPSLKDGAKVEDLKEIHDAHMDVATAPVKVRKQAEEIQRLVVAGAIDPTNDFPGLVAQGLDADVVKYWKQMWGEAKDPKSTQFASDLVKEHQKKKADEEMETYRVKLARSYELANEMADAGLCGGGRESITEQVNSLMKFEDEAFNSMKRMAERQISLKKSASAPQALLDVGTYGSMVGASDSIVLSAPEAAPSDLKSGLDAAFASKKY